MGIISRIFGGTSTPSITATVPKQATQERDLTRGSMPLFGTPTASGLPVNVRSALSIPAVYAAVSNVSDTISTLPLPVYVRANDQGAEKNYDHPVYKLLNKSPNPVQTAKSWRAALVVDLMTTGEHFSEIVTDGYGDPVELWRIDGMQVRTEWAADGRTLTYIVGGRELDPVNILHVIGFSLDGYRGISPLTLCRDSLSLTLATERFGSKFFANGARPSGLLTMPPGLAPEDRAEAAKNWSDANSGVDNTAKTACLPNGFQYQQFSLAPEEGQYHETRVQQLRECQRIMRVPPTVVADYERQTWSNIQYSRMDLVQNTLRPIVVAIEQELNRKLFSVKDQDTHYVEHTLEGLLRGSPSEQIAMLTMATGGPIYTPNEARRILGLPAHDQGDGIGVPSPTQPVAPEVTP